MRNDKAFAINIANRDKPFLAIVSSKIGLQNDRSFENEGREPEIDLMLPDI